MACIGNHSDPHTVLPTAATGSHLAKNGEPVALRAAFWNAWLPAPGLTGNVSLIHELTCACIPAQGMSIWGPQEAHPSMARVSHKSAGRGRAHKVCLVFGAKLRPDLNRSAQHERRDGLACARRAHSGAA